MRSNFQCLKLGQLIFLGWSLLSLLACSGYKSTSSMGNDSSTSVPLVTGQAKTFSQIKTAIFDTKCASCHNGSTPPDLTSYQTLMAGTDVVAGSPLGSKLYTRCQDGTMPPSNPLSASDQQDIYNWIAAGAQNDPPVNAAPPSPASSLVASAGTGAQIILKWMDNSSDETGFKIERSTSAAGTFTVIATVAANAVNYTDSAISASTTYYYEVVAANGAGDATASNIVNITAPAATPSAPTFAMVNANVLKPSCVGCHSTGNAAAGYSYSTYAATLGSVVAGNSAKSPLYTSISSGSMPKGSKLTAAQIAMVKSWIDAGALNN